MLLLMRQIERRVNMKRFLILFLAVVTLFSVSTFASVDTITFRDIEWWNSEPKVKKEIEKMDDIKPSLFLPEEENARIDGWYHPWEFIYSEPNVENGGVLLNYDDVNVAGYKADLELYFMYKIKNGLVSRNIKDTSFYQAKYTIDDLEDIDSVFEDITTKLTSKYGEPEDKSYYDHSDDLYSPKGYLWTAGDGSIVWIGMYYNSYDDKYSECWIFYSAPNVDKKLDKLNKQIQNETINEEAARREENASNTDGL